jgi:hypothetical protein
VSNYIAEYVGQYEGCPEIVGHSDIAITLGRYSHLLPSMQKEIVDRWEDMFGHDDAEGKDLG